MSNGDGVLDNWEEIDEVGLTNTLQKIQSEHNEHQFKSSDSIPTSTASTYSYSFDTVSSDSSDLKSMKLLERNSNQDNSVSTSASVLQSPLNNMAAAFQPVMMVLHKSTDDYESANYTQPVNSQTVKILRRPTQSTEPRNNGIRPRPPIKTLQQREQEYAEARLRILGSAKNPEDELIASNTLTTTPLTNIGFVATPTKVNTSTKSQSGQNLHRNYYQPQHQQQQQQQLQNYYHQQQPSPAFNNRSLMLPPNQQLQQQAWSPVVGGSVSSLTLRQQQDSILRMPRGPDGSNGFQIRR